MTHKYIRLHPSGKRYYFSSPNTNQFTLEDLVWSLSRTNRFIGHTSGRPYNTLQHSCLCFDMAPRECKPEALGHDFSEGVTGDMNAILKTLCPDFRDHERRAEKLIAKKLGFIFPYPSMVKQVDLRMLATEMKSLTPRTDYKDLPYPPYEFTIKPWTEERARTEFAKRWPVAQAIIKSRK